MVVLRGSRGSVAFTLLIAGLFVAGMASGCGGCEAENGGPLAERPLIESFTVEPSSIQAEESARLTWEVRNAASIALVAGEEILLQEEGPGPRSFDVFPAATTTYTLTVHGEEDLDSVSSSVTLEVLEPEAPEVLSFEADPSEIVSGDSATLSWLTAGGEEVEILDGEGDLVDLGDASADEGSVTVEPRETTRYTLGVVGRGGHDEMDVEVAVLPAPIVSELSADPSWPVLPGTTVTLNWETEGAHHVTILLDDEILLETEEDMEGALDLHVERRKEITVVAAGALGSEASSTLVIPVIPVIEELFADGTVVREGDTVTFSWVTRGADSLVFEGPDGLVEEVGEGDVEQGSLPVSITSAGDFTLTAQSGDLEDVASLFVDVTDAPRIHELFVTPHEITEGDGVTVSWTVHAADSLTLEVSGVGMVDVSQLDVESDQIEVQLVSAGEAVVTLTAFNASGRAEAHETVDVVAIPEIDFLRVMPRRVASGESVEISWATGGAETVRLEKDGADLGVPGASLVGSVSDVVHGDATYRLAAANRLGHESHSEEVLVTVGPPRILMFQVSSSAVAPGGSVSLSWSNEGGAALSVSRDGEEVCQSSSTAEIAEGGCNVTLPSEVGPHSFVLSVENGAGSVSATVDVLVSDGPIITAFSPDREAVTSGEPVLFSWVVDDDVSGAAPELSLTDDLGGTYDLAGLDPNQDHVAVVTEEAGSRVFTLTAATEGTSPHEASLDVSVVEAPVIEHFAASPASIDSEGGTVQPESTLSWETSAAVSSTLWKLDAGGSPLQPALFDENEPAMVGAGQWDVEPAETTAYRLVARNDVGFEVEAEVRVVVDGAYVSMFSVEPPEIVAGETVTVEWETERAESVDLEPAVRQVAGGYSDIREIGERIDFQMSPTSMRYVDVDFPDGFSFPYYGVDRESVRISYFGAVSFQFSSGISWSNSPFPGGTNVRSPMIAVFWDYIRAVDESLPHAFYHFGSDEDGDYMRIQWSDFEHASWSHRPSSFNFQLVLRDDGRFEMHYGVMEGVSTATDGSRATIGFDDDDGVEGMTFSHNEVVPGGLHETGFVFNEPPLEESGSLEVSPKVDTTFVLTASNSVGSDSVSDTVTVYPSARLRSIAHSPQEIEDGDDFEIVYEATGAAFVEVLDDYGVTLCSHHLDPSQTEERSCAVGGLAPGDYEYHFEATSFLPHHKVSRTLEVTVHPLLEITSFEVDEQSVLVNEWVTFEWTSVGAEMVELFIGGSPNVLSPDANPAAGSFSTVFHQTTDVVLRVTGPGDRYREETITVFVNVARIDDLSVSSTHVSPGETITLSWQTSNADSVVLEPGRTEGPISDIRDTGEEVFFSGGDDTGHADIPFPDGFFFPYFEWERSEVRMMTDGFLSFNHMALSTWDNTELPSQSSRSPVMAPFWDDLHLQDTGEAHYELVSGSAGDSLVIQWSSFQFSHFEAEYNPADLTFQVILHDDGSFEYRFDEMTSEIQERADGAMATMGYEDDYGYLGHLLSFESEIEGGLSNRGWLLDWRLDYGEVDPEGSIEVAPRRDTTFTICATGLGWTECEDVTVEVQEE